MRTALVFAYVAAGLLGRRFLPEPSGWRPKRVGALTYLQVLEDMDPSSMTLAYLKRRRAEIEAETA